MCDPVSVVTGIGIGVSAYTGVQAQNAQVSYNERVAQEQTNSAWRSIQTGILRDQWKMESFLLDMKGRSMASAANHAMWMENAAHQMNMLEFEVSQKELAMKKEMWDFEFQHQQNINNLDQAKFSEQASHEQTMSNQEWATKTMEAAWEAAGLDISALRDRIGQLSDKAEMDVFEVRRASLKEQAMLRVAQAESGLEGNSARKEHLASVMQQSLTTGVIERNFRGALRQEGRNIQKVIANAKSRQNEALSQVVNRYVVKETSSLTI